MMNAFRNLYRIKNNAGKIVAMVTGKTDYEAVDRYTLATGDTAEVSVERMSCGYPTDMLKIC